MTRPIALITGATRGIGRAVVDQLAHDHHLLIGGRYAETVQVLVDQLPSAAPFVADLGDPDATEAACVGIDRLDVVVHCAGIAEIGPLDDMTRQVWREVLELDVTAVADLNRMLMPALRAAHGLVVAINSGAGLKANPDWGVYAAAKHALKAWADSLRAEEHGVVRVTSIHPGRVDTDMQRHVQGTGASYDGSKFLRPESVARAVRFAVDASEDAVVESLSIRPRG